MRTVRWLAAAVVLLAVRCAAQGGPADVSEDITAEQLQAKLHEAKAQVEAARGRVKQAQATVEQTTAAAKRAKVEADDAEQDANKAKEITQKHISEAKAAIKAAAESAKVNDLQQEQEQKELDAEMKLDEKQCGDRVKKWQEDAMKWKGQVDALKNEV